jgi:membrane associated rhomboid family serine protease
MKMGRKKFLIVFLLSAIAGNLAFMAFSLAAGSAAVTVIGASGAIFGLMGAAMLASPLEMVFYPYLIPVPLVMVAVLYTIFNIGSFIFVAIGLQESNVSFIAHIGGLVAGMAVGSRKAPARGHLE